MLLESMIEVLELPDSAYEKARDRYEDIGKWLSRNESVCAIYSPHIFVQGSFRLGTAIKPLDEKEYYDLDLVCKLRAGFTKDSFTQEQLKNIIGKEVEGYRDFRQIRAPKEEKHRCWCLNYQDELSFHIDILPCIPEQKQRQRLIVESMKSAGVDENLATSIAQDLISITDNRHHGYRQVCDDWLISNPQGYARWFESRMRQGLCENLFFAKGQIDDVPLHKRKTPLQRAIQLLKRHRNMMFKKDDDSKPISVIITTLSARAYEGEINIESALASILSRMGDFVNSKAPRVPNPVNPAEDFADKWAMPKYKYLNLEENFWNWLAQAQADFATIGSSNDMRFISEQIAQKFALNIDSSVLRERLGLSSGTVSAFTPKKHSIPIEPASPWRIM